MMGWLAVAAVVQAETCDSWARPLTPSAISREFRQRGAKVVAKELWCNPTVSDRLLTAIEKGTQPWLNVAAELVKVADGGVAFDLSNAISMALAINAAGVLRTIGPLGCGNIEAVNTRAAAVQLLDQQEQALAALSEQRLGESKRLCLEAIKEARDTLPLAQFEK